MRRIEVLFPLGIVLLNGWLLGVTLKKLPYTVEGVPGPGFLPFWLSLAIIILGLVLTVQTFRAGASGGGDADWPDRGGWQRIATVLGLLAVGLLLLNWLGFFAITVLYASVVAYRMGMRRWGVVVAVSLLTALGIYAVFSVWLKVPLPKGIFGL